LTFTHSIPWRIILHIGADSLASVGLEVNSNSIVVGRGDPAEGHTPGLDLGPFGAQDAGVSRRHAVIFASDESLFIRDLGSTNGTFVNGYALEPNQPYRLSEGDRIEFGQLLLTFRVVSAPNR
jgi:pSer/pThr/pTyr-binding forkhead associated (FHA) protein